MWRKILSLLLVAVLTAMLCACGAAPAEPEPEPQEIEEPAEPEIPEIEEPAPVLNPLTGLPLHDPNCVNSRPAAVMLNDIDAAMPQCGTTDADMIFEYNVEGGITRMVAFYQEPLQAGVIGSIRSARACFVETVLGMDAVYFHAGGSTEAINMIYQYGMDHNDGGLGGAYWRDEQRMQTMAYEHTLMTSGENVARYMRQSGMRTEHGADFRYPISYVENATPRQGEYATGVAVRFSWYKTTSFLYDAASRRYLVSQDYMDDGAQPYADGNTGAQVGVENLLVLRTTVYNSGDSSGHMVIDLQGGGEGMFFCGGKGEPIQWHKETIYDPFTFTHADGTDLALQAGRTYVCVIGNDASLHYGA